MPGFCFSLKKLTVAKACVSLVGDHAEMAATDWDINSGFPRPTEPVLDLARIIFQWSGTHYLSGSIFCKLVSR